MDIYIGDLSYQVTGEELEELFAAFGTVTSAKVIKDRETGNSKGFGFVEMPNQDEAENAIETLNESTFKGSKIKVNQARPKRNTRPRQKRRSW